MLNQGAVTVEVHTRLINDLRNRKRQKSIRNHPLILVSLIISVINIMVGNKIFASDVDCRIILSLIVQNHTLRIRKFTGTYKILKLFHTDQKNRWNIGKQYRWKHVTEYIRFYGTYVYASVWNPPQCPSGRWLILRMRGNYGAAGDRSLDTYASYPFLPRYRFSTESFLRTMLCPYLTLTWL